MERFIHNQNIKLFKKQLEAPTDEAQRKMLLRLLAEEQAKGGSRLAAKPKQHS